MGADCCSVSDPAPVPRETFQHLNVTILPRPEMETLEQRRRTHRPSGTETGSDRSWWPLATNYLIFFGSQTLDFFFTTAPQSLQRKRPGLALTLDSPFLQPITV